MTKHIFFLLLALSFFSCVDNNDDESADPSIVPANNLQVGASSKQLLSGEHFTKLIVEIQYPAGYALPSGTRGDMEAFLKKYVNKDNIQVIENEISIPANNQYSIQEILAVEEDNRSQFNAEGTMAVYLLLADGDYEGNSGNSKVLGVAYRNTSMALFQKTIQDYTGGIGQPSERLVTSTVLNHEVSHILGLVNVGTPMVTEHQDEAHGKHCDNEDCLMYWTAETGDVISNLLGMSSPPDLDAQCQADLEANGGK